MPRYAAFLRGVSPTNAKMPDLKRACEDAGFTDVTTVLSSGNVVFETGAMPIDAIQARAEAAMQKRLGRTFLTIVRPVEALRKMLERDPFARLRLAPEDKRVVTFLRVAPKGRLALPIERNGARILAVEGLEAFVAYVPRPGDPAFMVLIDKTFGKQQTSRTWQSLEKVIG